MTRLAMATPAAALLLSLPLATPATPSPAPVTANAHPSASRFVELKLKEGAQLSLDADRFRSASPAAHRINRTLARTDATTVAPLFGRSAATLDRQAQRLRADGHTVADLGQWYSLTFADAAAARRGVRQLAGLDAVAEVYVMPAAPPPPATPDFEARQDYRGTAPDGIGASAVAGTPGADGAGVTIVDVEYSWNLHHEDLALPPSTRIRNGTPCDPFDDRNHGTAVLGELVARDNGFGVTGIAHGASIGVTNAAHRGPGGCRWTPARAINTAADALSAGDVLIIEQQTVGPDDEYLPIEWLPSAYDAITTATARGVVVVEPAANGSADLDDPQYGSPFPQGRPDSGAIIVGASWGCSGSHDPASFSDFGSRVDVQGWGDCVATTGYGTLWGGKPNRYYTSRFAGTSSATPIVAGAVASIQGARLAAGASPLTPDAMRTLLVSTGTPQPPGGDHIGPQPNLPAAISGDTPPPRPHDLSAASTPNGIRLNWTATSDPDVGRYVLFRRATPWAPLRRIAVLDPSTTTTLDRHAHLGVTTSYVLEAVDSDWQVSKPATAHAIRRGKGVQQERAATFSGRWVKADCACYSGGSVRRSTASGDSARFTFRGSKVTLVTTFGPHFGNLTVYVDGKKQRGRLTFDSPERHYAVAGWSKTFATPGKHRVRFVVGRHAGSTRVDIDSFVVQH